VATQDKGNALPSNEKKCGAVLVFEVKTRLLRSPHVSRFQSENAYDTIAK
jgi:hypothetical protein